MRHHTLREGHVSRNQRCGARGEPAIPTRALASEHRPRRPASPQSQNTHRGIKNSTLAPTGSGQLRHPGEQLLPGRAPAAAAQCICAQTRKARRRPQARIPLRAPTGVFRSCLQLGHSGGRGRRIAVNSREKKQCGEHACNSSLWVKGSQGCTVESVSKPKPTNQTKRGRKERGVFKLCCVHK